MATNDDGHADLEPAETAEQCRVATNAVLDVALTHCNPNALKEVVAQMVGISGNIDQVLQEAPDSLEQSDCMDMVAVRGWVVNRVFELVENQDEDVADAVTTAWSEANDTCNWG